jgi:ATP-dependent RNA helicase MSS116
VCTWLKRPVFSVAQAKTGTGKTLAFLVPIVNRLIGEEPALAMPRGGGRARSDDIRAIIVSPTRELAEQIGAEAKRLCQGTGVVVQTAVGGTQKNMMLRKARIEGCHLLVATPGRLHDLLSDTTSGIDAPRLSALVLDEADRMLEVGFKTELESITQILPDRQDVPRQTLLYSATLPKNVVGIARQFINPTNFEFVQTVKGDETPTHERVPQFIVPCRGFENLGPTLLELVRRDVQKSLDDPERLPFKAIVFLPTTSSVQFYTSTFRRIKYEDRSMPRIYDIHSKLSQGQRTRSAMDFKDAKSAILFSSDVSARGMDFPNVSHVIQLHLPQDRDIYIHRIGRTGRAGKEGEAYLLASDVEIPAARDRLPGLPIQRCTDFECASIDVSKADELPPNFAEIRQAAEKTPYEVLKETYTSMLGNAIRDVDRQDIVHEINNMAKYTWGMEEPPALSPRFAQSLGRVRGLRVGESHRHGGAGDRGGYGGDRDRGGYGGGYGGGRGGGGYGGGRGGGGFGGRGGGGGFGGRGGREGRPRGDGFDQMARLAREDGPGDRGGRRSRPPPPSF